MHSPIGQTGHDVTLGILAGGRATRLQGLDKAWLQRDGVPQVVRCAQALVPEVEDTLVSANASLPRYAARGLRVVADRAERSGQGPIAALDALVRACATTWLLTLPVDVVRVPAGLVAALQRACDSHGAFIVDDDGPQPLVALWRVAALRDALLAIGPQPVAVHELHARMGSRGVRLEGFAFGNLNTPADLAAAGVTVAP